MTRGPSSASSPDGFFGDWILVEGRAEVLSFPEATELLVDYYRLLAGDHDDWDAFRASMRREPRVLIRIDALRAGPDRQG